MRSTPWNWSATRTAPLLKTLPGPGAAEDHRRGRRPSTPASTASSRSMRSAAHAPASAPRGKRKKQSASEGGAGDGAGGGWPRSPASPGPRVPGRDGNPGAPARESPPRAKTRRKTSAPVPCPNRARPWAKLLMLDSKVELSMSVSAAGEAVNVREIQVFTQKGLYTRRIMDEMGLAALNGEIGALRGSRHIPDRRLGQGTAQTPRMAARTGARLRGTPVPAARRPPAASACARNCCAR